MCFAADRWWLCFAARFRTAGGTAMWLCCAADRPREVKAKGMTGAKHNKMLEMADNPEAFKVPLDKACCAEPLCCVVGTACAFLPFPGFYLRSKVLTTYGNGIADFLCCQGQAPPRTHLYVACINSLRP